ncbi:PD-(D/E)XK nuclease family protein [Yeosuana sp. MJ-SS3]|uniref:PD-(D/E)XK nuclease family protein n=1 Tax=Gilvirhabdus luticola TaxID=3079858 RepID=A0ABU3U344_9FLAO|nr:PD-(D/E)XK nuclease family protein [Yeosuana sp. MJ-SS3]MDU8884759.1 PD-(D/E)XK nuclease family protein [Yeosuana sp. MJ-SS3]
MTTFIEDVLQDLYKKKLDLSELIFILPNKRSGIFLKQQIAKTISKTIFSPEILSIEEFLQDLSQLKQVTNSTLLFEFYNVYLNLTKKEDRDSFDVFSKWAQVLLQDFNEIDRFLIPHKNIFDYLSAIKETDHWSLDDNKSDFVIKYLTFWKKLYKYYNSFSESLLNQKKGYQGLIFREAVENIQIYIQNNENKKHVFLGFNALNKAEETIIQELLQNDMANIYWDIDEVFFSTSYHDAALFTKKFKTDWTYYKNHAFNWITNHYITEKNISVFGIPKTVGQAKQVGTILKEIKKEKGHLNNTAIVLGDENLLIPVLNSFPNNIEDLNITMGFPLKSTPISNLFETFFRIHKYASKEFYYKDVISIICHPLIRPLFFVNDVDISTNLIQRIQSNNLVYLNLGQLNQITQINIKTVDLLFSDLDNNPAAALKVCSEVILEIKKQLSSNKSQNLLALEYTYRFNELFNELSRLNIEYGHIKNISTLHTVYKELLKIETLDFKGEPLHGLQVMGMLESRVLDFETVIITSVNEGILPSGKTSNSFIPFDVKLENDLPTFKEKSAIYSYHFYRLLQRAKNIYLLYNTEIDVLKGGEKSRFITQLELEGIHKINHKIIVPDSPSITKEFDRIKKTDSVIKKLITVSESGFSPSSLTNYIRNPIDFYFDKILGIKELDDVEETVAANTLGTVVHNTLESFYRPIIGEFLTIGHLKKMKSKISESVKNHFKKVYKEGTINKGKNLIVFEVAKRFVYNFINSEIEELNKGNQIKIIAVEAKHKVKIDIPELPFPVYLSGTVDRVDEYNGTLRIIDYKTGKVDTPNVQITNWEDLTTDYTKYSKSFQVLSYAFMMHLKTPLQFPVEVGIISFKNLNKGFMKFVKKEENSRTKESSITQETLNYYFIELKKLILEICNPQIDFIEKEV